MIAYPAFNVAFWTKCLKAHCKHVQTMHKFSPTPPLRHTQIIKGKQTFLCCQNSRVCVCWIVTLQTAVFWLSPGWQRLMVFTAEETSHWGAADVSRKSHRPPCISKNNSTDSTQWGPPVTEVRRLCVKVSGGDLHYCTRKEMFVFCDSEVRLF